MAIPKEDTLRKLLIAAALGLGLLSGGAVTQKASAAPFNAAGIEAGVGVTPVQYYRDGYRRPYYGPRHYGPRHHRPRHYAPRPRHYGYYAPPRPYRHGPPPRPYYRRW